GGVGLVRALAAHRLDHVEGVVLAAQLGGDDAHRAGRDQVVGVHRALDPLAVGPHRALDGLVVALDGAGRHRQQVLGGQLDHAQVGQRHAIGAVVHVRDRREDAGELGQADLHVLADVAAHVHAGVTAAQVPTVVDGVGLGDLDVASAATGRPQGEAHALVVAAVAVLERIDHAAVGLALDDLPGALAERLGVVLEAGADARIGARAVDLHGRV